METSSFKEAVHRCDTKVQDDEQEQALHSFLSVLDRSEFSFIQTEEKENILVHNPGAVFIKRLLFNSDTKMGRNKQNPQRWEHIVLQPPEGSSAL